MPGGRWAAGTMAYRKPPVPLSQNPKWDVGERVKFRRDGTTVLPAHRHLNPYSPKTGEKCSCKRGIERDNCPRCEGTGWVIDFRKIHEERKRREQEKERENPMRRRRRVRGLPGVYGRPAQHYYVKKRRRRNPTRWGNSGRFVRNPGGGGWSKWLLIGGVAAAGLYFFGPQLSSMFGGGSGVPTGFTAVGSGLYRGPDGALYARNPQTGQMVKAPTTGTQPTDATDLLMRAGVQLLPSATNVVADWVRGLFNTSATAAPSATTPRPGSSSPSGSTSSGFPTGAIGSALPALPSLVSGAGGFLSGGSGAIETLPSIPAGDAWWDTIAPVDDAAAWALPDAPVMDFPELEALAPLDDWSVDWSMDGMDFGGWDFQVPDISYDIPDFSYDVPVSDFDFGFMGLGARHRRRMPSLLRRPASFR